jgi:class 3 adenylate cyclase
VHEREIRYRFLWQLRASPDDSGRSSPTGRFNRETGVPDAPTGADVVSLQAFRDSSGTEALRPGDELRVGSLTIVFTDLRDSTRPYGQIGDARAFGSVVEHFDVVRSTVVRDGGAIVKTIGDGVMVTFRRPVSALQEMLDAQLALASPPPVGRPLALKLGIHSSPCIAVTLNDRLWKVRRGG